MSADRQTVLVTGATGNQGGAVAARLLAAGGSVRALTRDPAGDAARALAERGAEVVVGDLDDRASLDLALEGVHGVFSVQNYWEHGAEREIAQGKNLIDAAAAAGVGHFVYSSVGGADRESGIEHFESKWEIENHLRASGLHWTILRPTFLMENLNAPHYRGPIMGGTLPLALPPDRKLQLLACEDIGAFTVLALQHRDRFDRVAIEIASEELTPAEIAERLTVALGRPVTHVEAPLERVRAMNPQVAEMFVWFREHGYAADLDALRDLHPEPLLFEAWLRRSEWDRMGSPARGRTERAAPTTAAQREAVAESGPSGRRDAPVPGAVDAPAEPDPASLFRLGGKQALVVGGYGGIGQLISEAFAKYGAEVAIAGRSGERATELATRLEAEGSRALGIQLDAADRASVERGVETVVDGLGGLDILVNCASLLAEARAEELSEDVWRRIMDVNLTGAFLVSQAAARAMLAAGSGGRIIHFSSTRSVAGARRGFSAYSASKGGLNMLVRQLATEWGHAAITVNAVAPGFVRTEFVHEGASDPKFTAMLINRIPMGRFAEPFEMVGATLFLASPAASFVTGQVIFVDGGVTASS